MSVHVQRRLKIRVPEKGLSGLKSFAVCMQERCVRVTERMPRDAWLFDPIAGWCKLPVVQVLIAERVPFTVRNTRSSGVFGAIRVR